MKPLIIVGAGGFAREVQWLLHEVNRSANRSPEEFPAWHVLGFIDQEAKGRIAGLPILGTDEWVFQELDQNLVRFVVAVGNHNLRKQIATQYLEHKFMAARLRFPGLAISDDLQAGPGSILCAGVVITPNVRIGSFTIVNLNSTIGHDAEIGDFVTIHPGVHISGGVKIGHEVEIGTGAVLLPGVQIGAGATIGAGAVVTTNVPEGVTYIGVPAKPMQIQPD